MDILAMLGAAAGLGFLAGIRLYATVLTIGLALKFQFIQLSPRFASLEALNDWRVISVAGAACIVEFLADKVPWLDSLWDALHTLVRPAGAALLAIAVSGSISPALQVILALLAGGVALSSHSTKAAARLMVNHSPEPFSNIILSTVEDVIVPLAALFTLRNPEIAVALVAAFLLVFALVAPTVFRILRIELAALGSLLSKAVAGDGRGEPPQPELSDAMDPGQKEAALRKYLEQISAAIPMRQVEWLGVEHGCKAAPPALRVVPLKGMRGLHRSTGYLCLAADDLVFVTRRWFKVKSRAISLASLTSISYRGGKLVDQLLLQGEKKKVYRFDVFKAPGRRGEAFAAALNSLLAVRAVVHD